MTQASNTASALEQLRPRLSDLYDRSVDLFETDLKRSHNWCIGDHCRRIWEMLDANDRALIRKAISQELRPLRGSVSDAWLDTYCIDAISDRHRRSAGSLPWLGENAGTYA